MTINVENDPVAIIGGPPKPARKHHWSTNSQTPLAKTRRRRTYAAKRLTKAQLLVEELQAVFDLAQSEVDELEALVAKGFRGLN